MARIRYWAPAAALVGLLAAVPTAGAQTADPVIAAAGDIACDPTGASFNNGDGDALRCRQRYTSDLLVGQGLAAVLALGDTQYEDGTLEQFRASYDLSWGRVKSITRPAIGNHEYDGSARDRLLRLLQRRRQLRPAPPATAARATTASTSAIGT